MERYLKRQLKVAKQRLGPYEVACIGATLYPSLKLLLLSSVNTEQDEGRFISKACAELRRLCGCKTYKNYPSYAELARTANPSFTKKALQ